MHVRLLRFWARDAGYFKVLIPTDCFVYEQVEGFKNWLAELAQGDRYEVPLEMQAIAAQLLARMI